MKEKKKDEIRQVIKSLVNDAKGAKEKKRKVQQECPHQKSNGKMKLVQCYDENGDNIYGLFKCSRCGAKIDLRPLKINKGETLYGKVKDAYKVINAAANYMKITSNVSKKEDEPIFAIAANAQKGSYRLSKLFKIMAKRNKAVRRDKSRMKKVSNLRVRAGGRSLY